MDDLEVSWNRCFGNVWCNLYYVNLDHPHFEGRSGVDVIWHGGPSPATVYIGSGPIRDRIAEHRVDPRIRRFASLGLYVTWADVPPESAARVVFYLVQELSPIVLDPGPFAFPIKVNLPW
jgi:hypothetical protein